MLISFIKIDIHINRYRDLEIDREREREKERIHTIYSYLKGIGTNTGQGCKIGHYTLKSL